MDGVKVFWLIGVDAEDFTNHQTGDGCPSDGLVGRSVELDDPGLAIVTWSLASRLMFSQLSSFRVCLVPFSLLSPCQCVRLFPSSSHFLSHLILGVEPTH